MFNELILDFTDSLYSFYFINFYADIHYFQPTSYSQSSRETKAGTQGKSLRKKSWSCTAFWLVLLNMLGYLSNVGLAHVLNDRYSYSGLGLPPSINT